MKSMIKTLPPHPNAQKYTIKCVKSVHEVSDPSTGMYPTFCPRRPKDQCTYNQTYSLTHKIMLNTILSPHVPYPHAP